ncbi:MAG TPA: hypothetical protein VIJ95_16215 [Hanamia sp.]
MEHKSWRRHEPFQRASAIGTTDFVTWEFIPLYQPPGDVGRQRNTYGQTK